MTQVLSGLISGGALFLLAAVVVWEEVFTYNRNFCQIRRRFRKNLHSNPNPSTFGKVIDLDGVLKRIRTGYRNERNKRVIRTSFRLTGIAMIIGILGAYIAHIFVTHAYTLIDLLPIPALFAVTILCFMSILLSENCCVYRSRSASDLGVWLGIILPSVRKHGQLKIVQGSMHPVPFSIEPFFALLHWLRDEKGVTIDLYSGKPDFDKMQGWQLEEWKKYRSNIEKYEFKSSVHILPERPLSQFVLTDRIVRVEEEHPPWTERQTKKRGRIVEGPVTNHISLFDLFLKWTVQAKLKRLAQNAKPLEEELQASPN